MLRGARGRAGPLPGRGGPANVGVELREGGRDAHGLLSLVVAHVAPGGPAAKTGQVRRLSFSLSLSLSLSSFSLSLSPSHSLSGQGRGGERQ